MLLLFLGVAMFPDMPEEGVHYPVKPVVDTVPPNGELVSTAKGVEVYKCIDCAGKGRYRCDQCGGTGAIFKLDSEELNNCRACLGDGSFEHEPCNGSGRIIGKQ